MHPEHGAPGGQARDQLRAVKDYFSRNSGDWDAMYRGRVPESYNYRARAAAALHMLHRVAEHGGTGRLLDIGSGAGFQAAAAGAAGWEVVGVDLSLPMLRRASANAPQGLWVVASADALPFRGGTFDAAMMLGVVGYLPEPVTSLREVRASVRPDGHLVVSTLVNQRFLLDRLSHVVSVVPDWIYLSIKRVLTRAGPQEPPPPGAPSFFAEHNTRRTEQQLESLLTEAGWRAVRRRGINYGRFRFMGKRLWPERFDETLSDLLTQFARLPGAGVLRRTAMTTLVLAVPTPE